MPNTGEVQRKGFKHEIFVKKLKDFEQRTTQNAKHCCQNAAATSALLKAELVYSRYSPVKDFQALHEERLVSSVHVLVLHVVLICILIHSTSLFSTFHHFLKHLSRLLDPFPVLHRVFLQKNLLT